MKFQNLGPGNVPPLPHARYKMCSPVSIKEFVNVSEKSLLTATKIYYQTYKFLWYLYKNQLLNHNE